MACLVLGAARYYRTVLVGAAGAARGHVATMATHTAPADAVVDKAPSPSDAVVGRRMRVTADDGCRQRALVLCVMDDKHHCGYQVEYDDGTEAVVPVASVQPLFDWEYEAPVQDAATQPDAAARHAAAERLKSQGNELFKLKDAAAALQMYMLALRELQADCRFEPGARCLVKPAEGGNGALRAALLLTVEADGSAADLEYEPALSGPSSGRGAVSDRLSCLLEQAAQMQAGEALAASGEDEAACEVEEDGVPRGRVAMLVHHEHAALQCVASRSKLGAVCTRRSTHTLVPHLSFAAHCPTASLPRCPGARCC